MSPVQPYSEAGYTITPSNFASAVFDAAYPFASFPGDPTSWLGFAGGNTITLTGTYTFSLDSALMGPSTIGFGVVDFTVTGFLDGGGTVSQTFNGLAAATTELIGFTHLDSVQFTSTSDAGLDDIQLHTPEPASLLLLVAGFAGIAAMLRRRRLAFA